jgi:fermentation-respiration switch protein FrsA (DUF1100 family)
MWQKIVFYVLVMGGLYVVFRFFEHASIYYPNFPSRQLEITPAHIGLRFENVVLTTADGVHVHGWFVHSPSENPPPRPALLFFHGNAGNISHRIEMIQQFAAMGLDVFIIDYRGYGQSSGRPNEKGLYEDARAAYAYLRETRQIPPEKIVLFGESLGGCVAIDLAAKVDAAALITVAAFSSTKDMARAVYPILPFQWLVTEKFDAASKIGNARMPVMLLHSRDDEIVPFKQAEKLHANAHQPKTFFELTGTHNDAWFVSGQAMLKAIRDFIGAHAPLSD